MWLFESPEHAVFYGSYMDISYPSLLPIMHHARCPRHSAHNATKTAGGLREPCMGCRESYAMSDFR